MKKSIIFFVLALFLISLASADIIIHQQPNEVYNLGDTITIPLTITTIENIKKPFEMNLICSGGKPNLMYYNYISLLAGEEKTFDASMVLTKEEIGETVGTCKIKAKLGNYEPIFTKDFEISGEITIISTTKEVEFSPGQSILIKGDATKKNGRGAEGLINIQIGSENSTDSITQLGTINEGFFSVNITFPATMGAGAYLVRLDAYEKDLEGFTTNTGFINYNIKIKQVPTSLEILFEKNPVEPGTNLMVKTVLHDQTGEPIASTSIITIKKDTNEIQEQTERPTNEYLEYPIKYNEPPSNWTVVAVSNKLTSEANFIINEKKEVKVEIVNKTVLIKNTGNVFYNDTVLIKIGEDSVHHLNTSLEVDEEQKYLLSAPDGEYQIEIIANGESRLSEEVFLTGKAINVKELKKGGFGRVATHPLVWVFIILILGFVAFLIIKKGSKRTFFGRFHFKKKLKPRKVNIAWENRASPLRKNSILKAKNKAEFSLSIKGSKQTAGVICIHIKNLKEIQSKKTNAEETLQKIVEITEEKKAVVYETQDYLFFILAPEKTKTFRNEKTILELAQKIKQILAHHNKLFQQKIKFGISLNSGAIIAKQEENILKFMSMGTLMTAAKKVASVSEEEIFLCEEIKKILGSEVRSEEHKDGKIRYYSIKEIRNKEENSKFIHNFLRRLESEKKKD